MDEQKPDVKLTRDGLKSWMSSTDSRISKGQDIMHLVILVLLFTLGGIVISTGLWVADAFINKNKPQIIYTKSLDTTNENLRCR